jgi:hypothetical protein
LLRDGSAGDPEHCVLPQGLHPPPEQSGDFHVSSLHGDVRGGGTVHRQYLASRCIERGGDTSF